MKITRKSLIALGAAALMALPGTASAEEVFRVAAAARPGSVMEGIISAFIKNFNEQAGPDYKLDFQFVGSDQEIIQQVIRRRLEIGTTSLAGAAVTVPAGAVMSMPYLWDNDAQRRWVTDNYALPAIAEVYAEKGLEVLGMGDTGWSNVFCKGECTSPADVDGKRFRIPPAASARAFWDALDINGVQLSLPDFFTGLEQGMVVGGDLPFTFFVTTPAAEFAEQYVTTNQYHHDQVFFMNKALFDSLPENVQTLLKSAMLPAEEMRARQDEDEKAQVAKFEGMGGKYIVLSDEERKAWADSVGDVHTDLLKELPEGSQKIYDAVQEGKQAYAEKN